MKLVQKTVIVLIFLGCLGGNVAFAQSSQKTDSLIFEDYAKTIKASIRLPLNELLIKTALYFLGKPYVGGTLEQGKEHLVINLRELDCTTFVETCMALSVTMQSPDKSFAHFRQTVQKSRYRNGVIDGYSSRLHYSSDWIFDNEKKGFWTNITRQVGGCRQDKTVNFMSSHYSLYPAIKDDSLMRHKIVECENAINERNAYAFIPKEKIDENKQKLRNGDIIFFGTKIDGLDFSHVAIVYWDKGILTFIHASSGGKKVMVQPTSLAEYCQQSKNCNGIAVVRLNQ